VPQNATQEDELDVADLLFVLKTGLMMMLTVDWTQEMSSEFQTDSYSTEIITTSSGSASTTSSSLIASQAVLAFIGFLGTFTNGLVLVGFWLSDRSQMTSSTIYIVNHTALGLVACFFITEVCLTCAVQRVKKRAHFVDR